MIRRKLGLRGPEVSQLGFGCMRFPTKDGKIERNESTAMLRRATEGGVDYWDTAWPYHDEESEIFMADVLADFAPADRDRITIADKMPTWLVNEEADLDRFFNNQRRRLKRERIDVYLLHALDAQRWPAMRNLGALEWLAKKKDAGEIGCAGFSFHDEHRVFAEIIGAWDWDVCQIQYNFMDIEDQAGRAGLKLAHEAGIGVIVMEPVLGGNLVEAPPEVAELWKASAHPDWSPVERALRWVWDQEEVGLVLSGMSSLEQVEQNIAVAGEARVNALDEAEQALYGKVRETYRNLKAIGCTDCRYCMPCPHGVNIPWNFKAFNRAAMYSNLAGARGEYSWMLSAYKKGLEKTDPRAANCVSCGECEVKCPQKLPIADLMPEVASVLSGEKGPEEARI